MLAKGGRRYLSPSCTTRVVPVSTYETLVTYGEYLSCGETVLSINRVDWLLSAAICLSSVWTGPLMLPIDAVPLISASSPYCGISQRSLAHNSSRKSNNCKKTLDRQLFNQQNCSHIRCCPHQIFFIALLSLAATTQSTTWNKHSRNTLYQFLFQLVVDVPLTLFDLHSQNCGLSSAN